MRRSPRVLVPLVVALSFGPWGAGAWAETVLFLPERIKQRAIGDFASYSIVEGSLRDGSRLYLIGEASGTGETARFADGAAIYVDGVRCSSYSELSQTVLSTWYRLDVALLHPNPFHALLGITDESCYVATADEEGLRLVSDLRGRTIYLDSSPSGAQVYVRDVSAGTCPLVLKYEGPVVLSLRFSLQGYEDQDATLDTGGDTAKRLTIDMGTYDMDPRTYTIRTSPSAGVDVYAKGAFVGRTTAAGCSFTYRGRTKPFTMELRSNGLSSSYTLDETRAGSWTYSIDFDAEAREVTLTTTPSAADIAWGGKALGRGQAKTTVYGRGPHSFVASLNGLQASYGLETPEKKAYALEMAFDAEPRILDLRLEQKEATARLNDQEITSGPHTVYGPSMQLAVAADGYLPYEESISSTAGETVVRNVRLKPDWPAQREAKKQNGFHIGGNVRVVTDPTMQAVFPLLAGARFGGFFSKAGKPGVAEFGVDVAYGSPGMRLRATELDYEGGYILADAYGGLGLRVWLGASGYIYGKVSGIAGMAMGWFGAPAGYLSSGSSQLFALANGKNMAAYVEGEAAVGLCLQGKKSGIYLEAGARPQRSGDGTAWTASFVFQGGLYVGRY